jgi:glycosyltransferase involved in cell wall biosynthesis
MVSSFLHHRGGDGTCIALTTGALEARGHEVIPFAMRHPDNPPNVWDTRFPPQRDVWGASGLARVREVLGGIWNVGAARALDALLADVRVDVAHLHHVHRHLTPSVLGPLRRRGVRVVWTVHDYELVCPNAALWTEDAPCERCLGHRYHEAVRHRCKRESRAQSAAVALEKAVHAAAGVWGRVDRFVCPSRFAADRLVRFGIDPARVTHLPNPVEDTPAREEAGGPVVFAGRLSPEKGVDVLIAAARRLPDRPFRVVGGGPELERLRRGAPANVTFVGGLDRAGVARELLAAGVVAVPSRWQENDPYAVLEAQAAGRPVVASAVGGIPEQIAHDVDGLLVPPGNPVALADAIGRLLEAPATAARIGANAHARVRQTRDTLRYVARLERIYSGDS